MFRGCILLRRFHRLLHFYWCFRGDQDVCFARDLKDCNFAISNKDQGEVGHKSSCINVAAGKQVIRQLVSVNISCDRLSRRRHELYFQNIGFLLNKCCHQQNTVGKDGENYFLHLRTCECLNLLICHEIGISAGQERSFDRMLIGNRFLHRRIFCFNAVFLRQNCFFRRKLIRQSVLRHFIARLFFGTFGGFFCLFGFFNQHRIIFHGLFFQRVFLRGCVFGDFFGNTLIW